MQDLDLGARGLRDRHQTLGGRRYCVVVLIDAYKHRVRSEQFGCFDRMSCKTERRIREHFFIAEFEFAHALLEQDWNMPIFACHSADALLDRTGFTGLGLVVIKDCQIHVLIHPVIGLRIPDLEVIAVTDNENLFADARLLTHLGLEHYAPG